MNLPQLIFANFGSTISFLALFNCKIHIYFLQADNYNGSFSVYCIYMYKYICMYMYLTNTLKLNIVSSIIKTLKMWVFLVEWQFCL